MRIAGAIIAGGRSTRMGGGSKAFEMVGARTILDRVIAALAAQTEAVAINSNDDNFAATGLTVIPDVLTEIATPLVGIHASLAWAAAQGFDILLTAPSDTPFLPKDLAARLIASCPSVAASGGQSHFVIGAWPVKLVDDLAEAIRHDNLFRVKDWVRQIGAATVEWPVTPFDPFFNVNTPEDLAEARRIATEFGA